MSLVLQNPKLGTCEGPSAESWYPYYAGYSAGFVKDLLLELGLGAGDRVLDPWNGSGTTSSVVHSHGLAAIGYDLNPALVVVAKGRALDRKVLPSVPALTTEIIAKARSSREEEHTLSSEPLARWFAPSTARHVRSIESAIYHLLVEEERVLPGMTNAQVAALSTLAAFYYVALFRTVRGLLSPFRTSNPTWVKEAKKADELVRIDGRSLTGTFRRNVQTLRKYIEEHGADQPREQALELAVASSEQMPLAEDAVEAVVGSPPYCTRIDYVISSLPELATLGTGSGEQIKALRSQMMGTPTMKPSTPSASKHWGKKCSAFLDAVKLHPSRASATYYYKYFVQYFDSLSRSLAELERVLVPGGSCALVVQDSYYKDVHNDLPAIVAEMAWQRGWGIREFIDFDVVRTKASMNSASRKYRASFDTTESLVILEKGQDLAAEGRRA